MTGHRKDKKPAPTGGSSGCPIVLAPVVGLAVLLLGGPRWMRTVADLHAEAARQARPPLWRRLLLRQAADCPYCVWPGAGHAPACPRAGH